MNAVQLGDWLKQFSQSPPPLFQKPQVMGIVNVTSDSFSDGGHFISVDKACAHAFNLIAQGADIIDVGGESTKPGARKVPFELELKRVIPVIKEIRRQADISISVDTYKPRVMRAAIDAGATLINDVYALRYEGALTMAAQLAVPICLMHMQGEPQTMQHNPCYNEGVFPEIRAFLSERINACLAGGIAPNHLIIDPGFGFGKRTAHNMDLLYHINKLQQLGMPILLGVSRKSTIGAVLNTEVDQRLIGGVAIAVYAALNGVAMIRTHDVLATQQALKMVAAIYQATEYN